MLQDGTLALLGILEGKEMPSIRITWGATPRVSDSVGLAWDVRISNKLPDDANSAVRTTLGFLFVC